MNKFSPRSTNKLQKLSDNISCWLRSCPVCRFSVPPIHWLCDTCWKYLKSCYLSPPDMIRSQDGLMHIRLLDWNNKNNHFIRQFLNSLKKGGPLFIFNHIMEEFFYRILLACPPFFQKEQKAIIVPAPSCVSYPKDHAFLLAKALCELIHLPVHPLLKTPQKTIQQKKKTRMQRKKNLISSTNNSFKNVIFVDDILTTGSTALASYQALNRPRNFKIVTLAWKTPPLANDEK